MTKKDNHAQSPTDQSLSAVLTDAVERERESRIIAYPSALSSSYPCCYTELVSPASALSILKKQDCCLFGLRGLYWGSDWKDWAGSGNGNTVIMILTVCTLGILTKKFTRKVTVPRAL
jgi:hypothetical protein